MALAPVKRFSFKRLYRNLARKGSNTTVTSYTRASPVLASPQPALKVIKTEPIFIIDCKSTLPSIDSVLALVNPAEQEPLSFPSAESISTSISPFNEQIEDDESKETGSNPSEEQNVVEPITKAQEEEVEDGNAEEDRSEALFSLSEDSSDASSIINITTATTPSIPPSPRFNPSFEPSNPPAEDSPSPFTSNCDANLSTSPSSQGISTWISLTTKVLCFNPSFERTPSSASSTESPSPLESSSFAEPDAALSFYSAKSTPTSSNNNHEVFEPFELLSTTIPSTSERYASFISWDSPSPRRRRPGQRA